MRTYGYAAVKVDVNLDAPEHFFVTSIDGNVTIEVHGLTVMPPFEPDDDPFVRVGGYAVRKSDGKVGRRYRTDAYVKWLDVPVAVRNAVLEEFARIVSEIPHKLEV